MKAVLNFVAVCFFSFVLVSCQKELSIDTSIPGDDDNNNNDTEQLEGNWNFISFAVDQSTSTLTVIGGQSIRGVSSYSTISTENTGILIIDANTIKASNFGYTIATDVKLEAYDGGIKTDEQILPLDFTMPKYSATSNYQKIGSDSLYFPNGSIFSIPDAGNQSPVASMPMGAKFFIKSDSLFVTAGMNAAIDTLKGGIPYTIDYKAKMVASFKKQ